jgi:hypothetical protein
MPCIATSASSRSLGRLERVNVICDLPNGYFSDLQCRSTWAKTSKSCETALFWRKPDLSILRSRQELHRGWSPPTANLVRHVNIR